MAESLKLFIQVANRAVAAGGAELARKAAAAGHQGSAGELVALLRKHAGLFDGEFAAQLPGLEKHLATRSQDNLRAMMEVVGARLSQLASGPVAPAGAVPVATAPAPEEDFSALLQQKSVDEMSEEERAAIAVKEGAAHAEESVVQHVEVADQSYLDELLSEAETPSPASAPAPPPPLAAGAAAEPAHEEDFSALLEQKSVDEMSEEERAAIALKEHAAASPPAIAEKKPEKPSTPDLKPEKLEEKAPDELDALLAGTDPTPEAAEEKKPEDVSLPEKNPAEQKPAAQEELDALLAGEPAAAAEVAGAEKNPGKVSPPDINPDNVKEETQDELDALLAGEGAAQGATAGSASAAAGDPLDALLAGGGDPVEEARPAEPPAAAAKDEGGEGLDALLQDIGGVSREDESAADIIQDQPASGVQGHPADKASPAPEDEAASETEVETFLEDVPGEEDTGITGMIEALQEPTAGAEKEDITDLLSKATGREIKETDLENDPGGSVTLDELIHDAEESLKGGVTGERVVAEDFKLEQAGQLLYKGPDEQEMRRVLEEAVLCGQTAGIKLTKVITRGIVRTETEVRELPFKIRVEIGA